MGSHLVPGLEDSWRLGTEAVVEVVEEDPVEQVVVLACLHSEAQVYVPLVGEQDLELLVRLVLTLCRRKGCLVHDQ